MVNAAFGLAWIEGIGITLRVGWWRRVVGLVDGDRVVLVWRRGEHGARGSTSGGVGTWSQGFDFVRVGGVVRHDGSGSGVAISLSCAKWVLGVRFRVVGRFICELV